MESGVADGSLDIALLSEPERKSIDFIPLLDDPMLVVFSEKHDLSGYDYVPVDILRDYPFIMTYQSYDRDVRKVFEQAGFDPEVKYYFRDDFAVLSMVQHGLGIAVLPELIIEIRNNISERECQVNNHPGRGRRIKCHPLANFRSAPFHNGESFSFERLYIRSGYKDRTVYTFERHEYPQHTVRLRTYVQPG